MEGLILLFLANAIIGIGLWVHEQATRLGITQAARRAEREEWWGRGYPDPADYAAGVYDGQ